MGQLKITFTKDIKWIVKNADGTIVSDQEQSALARIYGRHDWAEEIEKRSSNERP